MTSPCVYFKENSSRSQVFWWKLYQLRVYSRQKTNAKMFSSIHTYCRFYSIFWIILIARQPKWIVLDMNCCAAHRGQPVLSNQTPLCPTLHSFPQYSPLGILKKTMPLMDLPELKYRRNYIPEYCCPVGCAWRIPRLHLCRGVRALRNEFPDNDTRQFDGDYQVMLELWGMRSTPSLPLLPGPLWPGLIASDSVLSVGQIELNCVLMLNGIVWNRTVLIFLLCTYVKVNCLK